MIPKNRITSPINFQVLTGQPFDTIKVRMQTQTPTNSYSGLFDCVTKLLKNEGPLALYKVIWRRDVDPFVVCHI